MQERREKKNLTLIFFFDNLIVIKMGKGDFELKYKLIHIIMETRILAYKNMLWFKIN